MVHPVLSHPMKRLTGAIQPYAWGAVDAIPRLLGTAPDGNPQAEYWLGAHPSAPSKLDGTPLTSYLSADPAAIGQASRAEFGDQLPYLLKLLAAEQPLSLQVHPSRRQAREGFAREEEAGIPRNSPDRSYRDDWPKPEAIIALEHFEGLCGFRDSGESAELFRMLDIPQLAELTDPLDSPGGALGIEETFLSFLRMEASELWIVDRAVEVARGLLASHRRERSIADFCRTLLDLAEYHSHDPGVLAGALCNRVTLEPGDGLFLHAGLMHAYIRGTGVEIMANSDNVLRGGLTSKHVDVDELSRIVDFTPSPADVIEKPPSGTTVWRYPTPAPEFSLWRLELGHAHVRLPADGGARILIVLDGHFDIDAGQGPLRLEHGESLFVDARTDNVSVAGRGVGFMAAPGVGA